LSTVFVTEPRSSLDLDDDLSVANEVRDIDLPQVLPFVRELKALLGVNRNAPKPKLDLQAFLIDRLDEPTALLVVNLEARSDDPTIR